MIWDEIRSWYFRHGFIVAALNMQQIMREWQGHEHILLSKLKAYRP